eukprot:5884459-Prymnesium_polylepis.1
MPTRPSPSHKADESTSVQSWAVGRRGRACLHYLSDLTHVISCDTQWCFSAVSGRRAYDCA